MQPVLARAVRYEGIVFAPQLAHHVAQRKDGAEDELGVVLGAVAGEGRGGCSCGTVGRLAGCRGRGRGLRGGKPFFSVDALG